MPCVSIWETRASLTVGGTEDRKKAASSSPVSAVLRINAPPSAPSPRPGAARLLTMMSASKTCRFTPSAASRVKYVSNRHLVPQGEGVHSIAPTHIVPGVTEHGMHHGMVYFSNGSSGEDTTMAGINEDGMHHRIVHLGK